MTLQRIFISHSATDDPIAMQLLESLASELALDFAVRVDKEHIRLGDNWRQTLNTWLGGCDAAIILLSEKALKSAFVAYEASILSFRARSTCFTILPVFLDPVVYDTVEASALSPSRIHDIQAITSKTKEVTIADVKKRLSQVPHSQTPVDGQADYLCELLKTVQSDTEIKWGASMLDVDLEAWMPVDDIRRALALKMMCAGLEKCTPVIRRLRKHFSDQRFIDEMVNLVATSCVDLCAADQIASISRAAGSRPRLLDVKAQMPLIAQLCVLRASKDTSTDGWKVGQAPGVVNDQPAR
jgi:hypothetical protein